MTSPCDAIVNAPIPPTTPPEPYWDGTVSNATTSSGISGATIRLFKCNGTNSPSEVDSTTTDSNGDYRFEGFAPGSYYFAQADMTGPLFGMTVASGSENPTEALPVGPSRSGVDMVFE